MRAALIFTLLLGFVDNSTFAQNPNTPVGSPTAGQTAQSGTPLTLQQAEALALRSNPQITIGKLRALQAQQYVRETRSALLPTAYLSLTGVDAESGSRIAAGGIKNPILFTRAAGGAAVSQLVTDFRRTTNLVSSAEFQAKAEDKNAAATRADVVLAADQAFYNALETLELVKVAQQAVEARQTLVDRVQALANAKLRSDLDLSFANVDVSREKLLLLESQNNYQTALATLSAILGYPEEQNFQLAEPTEKMEAPAPDAQPLIAQALGQRPEVASLQFQVEAARKNSRAEHDLWRPTVGALGVAGHAAGGGA